MGKRGPQPQRGIDREANGRPSRKPLSAAERHKAKVEKETWEQICVVVNQPHRRHADNPEEKMLHSALGRFCKAAKCDTRTYEGVVQYAVMRERYRMAKAGGPKGVGSYTSSGRGNPEGPDEEQVSRWEARIKEAHTAVYQHCGRDGNQLCIFVSNIAVFHRELSEVEFKTWHEKIRHAMGEIAVVMGALEANPHPFK